MELGVIGLHFSTFPKGGTMSLKKHHVWVMMPVLGILLMSPHELEVKYGRHIASATPEPAPQAQEVKQESKTPKLDKLLTNVAIPVRPNPLNLNSDMLKEDISKLLSRVSKAEEFDKNTVQKPALDSLRNEIKTSAIELRQVEDAIKDLMNPEDEGDIRPRIEEAKVRLEASIKDLEETEVLVANRASQPAPEAPKTEVAEKPAVTPEAERKPSVVAEETKVEEKPAASESKPEKDPILCALEEQNKLLQQQLQNFVQQQGLIMTQLMQLSQMVMMQNMYRTPDTFNYQQMYQYQPQVPGSWVFQPAQPQQPVQPQAQPMQQPDQNIFGMNPYAQMPMAPMYGQYPQMPFQQPQMMNPGGGQWGLAPQTNFNHTPGSFGMDAIGFNFGGGPSTGTFM